MPIPPSRPSLRVVSNSLGQPEEQHLDGAESGYEACSPVGENGTARKRPPAGDRLLTAEQVAERLNVTRDWVWDHSSRKSPLLPVIRMSDGTLRYRATKIEEFINERERLTTVKQRIRVK
jgi:predicted DNA-binding transcriptional regulator AlpA